MKSIHERMLYRVLLFIITVPRKSLIETYRNLMESTQITAIKVHYLMDTIINFCNGLYNVIEKFLD